MQCEFEATGRTENGKHEFVCRNCRRSVMSRHESGVIHAQCTMRNRLPLGDWLAWLLAWAGITKQRVSWLLGRQCGCCRRQQKLNKLGMRITRMVWG